MKAIKTNLNLYKSFVEVYETKNYSNAAANLHLTQPTISYNIKELEKQLRVRLFNSNSRGVEPTKNADEIYPKIKQAFVALLNAENTVTEFNETSNGQLNINLSLFFMPQMVTNILTEYNAKFPKIKMNIIQANIEYGIQSLERHECDVLFICYMDANTVQYDKNAFTLNNIREIENVFYASKDFMKKHNITNNITKDQLVKLPIVTFGTKYQVRKELEKFGIAKNPMVETNSNDMLLNLAANGVGIVFAPESIDASLEKITVTDITMPKTKIAMIYNNEIANKAGTALIEFVKKQI